MKHRAGGFPGRKRRKHGGRSLQKSNNILVVVSEENILDVQNSFILCISGKDSLRKTCIIFAQNTMCFYFDVFGHKMSFIAIQFIGYL